MILGIGPPVTTGRPAVAGAATAGRARFSLGQAVASEQPARAGAAAEVALGGLLLLQEDPGQADDQDRPRRHAGLVLDELAALQRALLGSGDTGAIAERLRHLLETVPPATDPALAAAIRMVTLRARIETARIEMAHATDRPPGR